MLTDSSLHGGGVIGWSRANHAPETRRSIAARLGRAKKLRRILNAVGCQNGGYFRIQPGGYCQGVKGLPGMVNGFSSWS